MKDIRTGYGYDVHKLVAGRPLILGGVTIPHKTGLAGHSDADVLLHAICDALLGAAALGDIGKHFPDNDQSFKDVDSRLLLKRCVSLLNDLEYKVSNLDATVVAQQPKLAPHIEAMRSNIAEDIEVDKDRISVKATTSEELGFEGKREGISASATVLIYKE
ncbi:2-C-methyl-D-erythritol 2,4-cyclodiphosphate synthase [Aliifodinibius sp. S!AR15-10]|uniref:2-C-methyl-D-erythritol 2,4-cyclodiphosphate synthase n=1 Tax=Aliifodinibius sp. S!AR15-10 TaxID=2950437 RepID=UPI00285FED0B|nr:2-C-methyl-D-erythritol 2,4-cyclodiphosphate synthase [Aliifodinibius sp. S!AR15-10]